MEQLEETPIGEAGDGREMPVVVDPRFVRVFADQSLVMHLGRDMDVAFLAAGAGLQSVKYNEGPMSRVAARPQLNEVARVRLSPLIGATLAMQIMHELVRRNLVDVDQVISDLREYEANSLPDAEVDEEALS